METDPNIRICFAPTVEQLDEIHSWLFAEYKKQSHGFYANWNLIRNANAKGRVVVLCSKEKAIGFATWNEFEFVANIEIAAVNPLYRRKGFGRIMVKGLCETLLSREILVVQLHCQPPASEFFWKQMGFMDFPTVPDFANLLQTANKSLYKPLIPFLEHVAGQSEEDECIDLWDAEPYQSRNKEPLWNWRLSYRSAAELSQAIIFPCKPDWRLRWRKGFTVLVDKKVKYFSETDVSFGNFMIIRQMPVNGK